MKYKLAKLAEAIESLQIDPEQHYFPKPDEIAAEILRLRDSRAQDQMYTDAQRFSQELARWKREHEEFMAERAKTA